MSFRAIWIINILKEDYGRILLNRHFPTVEKRCRVVLGDKYVPLPPAALFCSNLLVTLRLADSKQFVEWRDKCCGLMQLPIVELNINARNLWPIISIAQDGLLLCCLPFVENQESVEKENLLEIPCISMGLSVLFGILNLLGSASKTERLFKMIEVDNFISMSMPFGIPSDVEASNCLKGFSSQKFLKKQPAWKAVEYKGKQMISIKILEFIRCIQNSDCCFETFGQVLVKADLEGGNNDVTLSISSVDPQQPLSLESLVIHPCVSTLSSTGMGLPKRLRFSPPLHELVLFHYVSSYPKDPPIKGVFKMVGENNVELLLQLKLNEKVKNSFDFCDLALVFFNKGPVKRMESNANHGSLKLSDDKYSLRWTIGSKFPKDLEITLTAKIEFQEGPLMPNSDPFCIEKNCYVQINFKQSNATLSGFNIDPKSVTVSEGSKHKIVLERSIQSTEYRIWNSYGDVPFPLNGAKLFNKICCN